MGKRPMDFVSTRDQTHRASITDALQRGLCPDGGLYVPSTFPHFKPDDFVGCDSLVDVCVRLLTSFLEGSFDVDQLRQICRDAFNFPTPIAPLSPIFPNLNVLELFHGPTCAFKDFGARFLAGSLSTIADAIPDRHSSTILVATSGDTGGAVASAFFKKPHFEVIVLYPNGLVSPRQAHQLSCWGNNIRTFAVNGTFDDCQRLVKQSLVDVDLQSQRHFSSANSINLGRLLPQAAYYAFASLSLWRKNNQPANFVIPSGNLGNGLACLWARQMGLPINRVVFATNANRTLVDYMASGKWQPRPSVATIASAMDVGAPSNMERMLAMFPAVEALRQAISAFSVTDDQIRAQIKNDYAAYGRIWCPHSATAMTVWESLSSEERSLPNWLLVATAHPAKFDTIVEPLIHAAVPVPPDLQRLFNLPTVQQEISAEFGAFKSMIANS